MDMKKRVSLELRDRSPAEVTELVLDNCRSGGGDVEGLTDQYTALEVLSMANAGLRSLAGLPALPRLRKLELSDNAISGGLDALVDKCPNLTHLSLRSNEVGELSSVQPLQSLKTLQSLDLQRCAVASRDGYRGGVFRLLPQLSRLDGCEQADGEDGEAPASDNDDDEDDDEDEAGPPGDYDDEDEEEGSEEEDEVGLSYLMKEGIQDEEDDGDYVEEEDEEDEDGDEDDAAVQGQKRKRDAEDEGDDDDDE